MQMKLLSTIKELKDFAVSTLIEIAKEGANVLRAGRRKALQAHVTLS